MLVVGAMRGRLPRVQDNADLFDYALLRHWVGFVLGSVRRHRVLAVVVLALGLIFTGASVALWPRTYHVETKILAQNNVTIALMGSLRRGRMDDDAPTRAASETVLRRDNLLSLIKQTNLVELWALNRPPLLRLKDRLSELFTGKMSDEDKIDAMVGTLEKRLKVEAGNGLIVLSIDWDTAQLAYSLVEAAKQNFLEAKHISEVSAIEEAISIMEVAASSKHARVEEAITDVNRVIDSKRRGNRPNAVAVPVAPVRDLAVAPGTPVEELWQLKSMIRAKRRSIADLEEFRNRRITELQTQLAEQKATYSELHPVVLDTLQRLQAMQQDSPQIQALKADEVGLLEEYTRKGGKDPDAAVEAPRQRNRVTGEVPVEAPDPLVGEDANVELARRQLSAAIEQWNGQLSLIDSARMELETARAAFKYRYSIINPAQLPKNPVKPSVPLMVVVGLFASVLMMFFAGTLVDVWRRRLVQTWQVERLGVPVLVHLPRA
jgi:uncharacterized coiled-coil protein SlyX